MTNFLPTEKIQALVRDHVAGEIVFRGLPDETSRGGCVVPLQYDNGDHIVVWVESWGGRFTVSDYGESLMDSPMRTARDQADLFSEATELCRPFGVEVDGGRLLTQAAEHELGEAVWRIAMAAGLVARVASTFRKARRHGDRDRVFITEVETELRARDLSPQRDVKLEGSSGHSHKATLFLPLGEAILEPIDAPGHFNQISSVYTKFGDLSHVNGYRRLSLVDDRSGALPEDLASMLVQVSDVVRWTRRDEWLSEIG